MKPAFYWAGGIMLVLGVLLVEATTDQAVLSGVGLAVAFVGFWVLLLGQGQKIGRSGGG